MDYHPKKKIKKKITEQIKNQTTVTSLAEIKTVYSIQSKNKSNPITQHCNTEAFIRKKKRNQIQSKRETKYRAKKKPQTPRANQTHGAAATARRRSSLRDLRRSSSSRRASLARRRRSSPAVVARRRPVVACPSSQIRTVSHSHHLSCSGARPIGLKVFLPLFLSDSLSLSLSLSH